MVRFVQRQSGLGLIEVLVSVVIISSSLLALTALQSRSLQFNHSAYLRSQANILAYDLLDRIRINRMDLSSYSIALDADSPADNSLSSTDLREWRDTLSNVLPEGRGAVTCNATSSVCSVSIVWSEQSSAMDASEESASFVFSTRI